MQAEVERDLNEKWKGREKEKKARRSSYVGDRRAAERARKIKTNKYSALWWGNL